MNFLEYRAHVEPEPMEMLRMAERLGWKGMCLVAKDPREIDAMRKAAKGTGMDVAFGCLIETGKPQDIGKIARKARKGAEIVMVKGGDLEINRRACETPEVDILCHPESGREDPGFDHVMARLARKNGVAIEFSFRSLLMSYGKGRSRIFEAMRENAKVVRKYNAPFVLTSGAISRWDLRSPSELISFGKMLHPTGMSIGSMLTLLKLSQ